MAKQSLQLTTKRSYPIQELLKKFAEGEDEVAKVEIGEGCYSDPINAYSSIRRAALNSEYKIGVMFRKGKIFLVKD